MQDFRKTAWHLHYPADLRPALKYVRYKGAISGSSKAQGRTQDSRTMHAKSRHPVTRCTSSLSLSSGQEFHSPARRSWRAHKGNRGRILKSSFAAVGRPWSPSRAQTGHEATGFARIWGHSKTRLGAFIAKFACSRAQGIIFVACWFLTRVLQRPPWSSPMAYLLWARFVSNKHRFIISHHIA